MKKRFFAFLLCAAMTASLMAGCGTSSKTATSSGTAGSSGQAASSSQTAASSTASGETASSGIEISTAPVASATDDQIKEYMTDTDDSTVLVDARPQEAYSGWALEGAAKGGHLKNAVLFSARWLDCEYSDSAPRDSYLDRAMKDQGITSDKNVIVYDYTGKQAVVVANYFISKGIRNVTVFKADGLIDAGTDLEAYTNYNMFIPTEIVKSISDVKTGKESTLSDAAKEAVGDDLSKVVLIDVGWGNAKTSTYFSVGHVPGAIHINTDSYERPRVYVPEKRSDYAQEWRLISLEQFRDEICTQYGITKDSTVILTTGSSTAPQGRLGFKLRSLGVKVYAMSGSLTAWTYNGYDLDKDASTLVTPVSVESFGTDTIKNPNEILWMDTIKKFLSGESDGQVVDNRGEDEWKGEYSGYSYHDLAGHIDGTVWCEEGSETEGEFFENVDHTPRTAAELTAYMESCGLDVSRTMAFFCGDSWGAAKIAYWCQSVDISTVKEWGDGWIPWSNEGNEFIDHNGTKVHYDKYQDTLLDESGKDVRDGTNILDDTAKKE